MVTKHSTADGEILNGTTAIDRLFADHLNVTMNGGNGDDEYAINKDGAIVNEAANGGWDTIYCNLDFFSIASLVNIEELHATNGLGGQTIIGNNGNNILTDGLLGDIADRIEGGGGNDYIYSERGGDTLVGGTGNDQYFIKDANTVFIEQAGEGVDTVNVSMASFSIEALLEIENLATRTNVNSTLTGNAGNNTIYGNLGDDVLSGGAGNDKLLGVAGDDTLIGGSGNDTFVLKSYTLTDIIKITEAAGGGTDTIKTGLAKFSLQSRTNVENLEAYKGSQLFDYTLIGNSMANKIKGLSGKDTLKGLDGKDLLSGGSGNDKLYGGTSDDILTGDAGADRLIGGKGKDKFDFNSILDSRAGSGGRDVIADFVKGDRIDLLTIDAKKSVSGNNKFSFIGASEFSKHAGELRYVQENNAGTSSDRTIVYGDVNGDGRSDIQIEVTGLVKFAAVDFIL